MPIQLPTIDDRPHADVLIFDGQCRFCRAQIRWISRCDINGRLAYISLHDPEVPRRWPDLTHAQLMEQMYVIDLKNIRHGGAEAFRYLTRILPPLWPLAPLLRIPASMPFWQYLYRTVAKFRYRLGRIEACDDGTCRLHARK
jgi:predicted DCC family thiol-disulfide oxidoreductase YuxK